MQQQAFPRKAVLQRTGGVSPLLWQDADSATLFVVVMATDMITFFLKWRQHSSVAWKPRSRSVLVSLHHPTFRFTASLCKGSTQAPHHSIGDRQQRLASVLNNTHIHTHTHKEPLAAGRETHTHTHTQTNDSNES
jgi:hypothetical protein